MRPSLFAAAALVAAACTHPPAPSTTPPPAPAVPQETGRMQAPLILSWEQQALSATGATVVAHVKRLTPMAMPMLVRIEVPAGAKLVSGRPQFTLAPNSEPGEVTETVELSFAAVPAEDLMLRVDAESPAAGFHFFSAWRFGRAEPPPPTAAQPEGPPVRKGDRNLGASVPIK